MALYHTAKGSVDYTMVGNPTIVDGVASGFSASDYLITSPQTKDITTCEWNMKFNTRTIPSVNGFVLGYKVNSGVIVTASKKIRVAWEDSTSTTVEKELNYILSDDTDYVLNCVFNNTNSTAIVTLKNSGGTTLITETYSDVSYKKLGTYFWIGMRGGSSYTNNYWRGSIDLNNTYIKVNEQPWFGLCPVEVQKHQLMGPVGYTKVGSPTIVDGVASGFSVGNYLRATRPLGSANLQSCDIRIKCKTGDAIIDNMPLLYCSGSPYWFAVRVNRDRMQLLTRNAENTGYMEVKSSITIQASMGYIIEATITTDKQTLKLYTWDGELLSNNFLSVGGGVYFNADLTGEMRVGSSIDVPWTGFIDLNETYIKVNDKLWFYQPQETKYIVKDGKLVWADPRLALSGPVNYKVVGNPTIVDGVASGFSASDYLQCQELTIQAGVPYEIATAIITPSDDTQNGNTNTCGIIGAKALHNGLLYTFSNHPNPGCINFYGWQDNSGSVNNATLFQLEHSTLYYVKYGYDGGRHAYVSVSQDKINWETKTRDYVPSSNTEVFYIGALKFFNSYFPGSIDLNETYVKVNDKLWFYGKNYATQNIAPVPAGYTFGTTTTPSIGYVDMRTQVFTAAPAGATVGRDL